MTQEKKETNDIFQERLAQLMESHQEYPASIARALGMSQPQVHNYAAGRIPRAEELAMLARHFGVTMEWLLGISEEKSRESLHNESYTSAAEDVRKWRKRALESEANLLEAQARIKRMEIEVDRLLHLAQEMAKPGDIIAKPADVEESLPPRRALVRTIKTPGRKMGPTERWVRSEERKAGKSKTAPYEEPNPFSPGISSGSQSPPAPKEKPVLQVRHHSGPEQKGGSQSTDRLPDQSSGAAGSSAGHRKLPAGSSEYPGKAKAPSPRGASAGQSAESESNPDHESVS